ncbi:MAG: HlyD family efflux transporter periplasmic adaptor subunit [Firmicutes bacterium]|nr:HlyD family efflux transporter periplasmic adaptor subunit [Bacillota bacterium]
MKKYLKLICIISIILITTITFGCNKKKETNVNKVNAKPPVKEDIIEAFGVIKVKDIKNITLNFPALVKDIHVVNGQRVKNGDVLVTLNLDKIKDEIKYKQDLIDIYSIELDKILKTSNDVEKILNKLPNKDMIHSVNEDQIKELINKVDKKSSPQIKQILNDLINLSNSYKKDTKELIKSKKLLSTGAISQQKYDSFKKSLEEKKNAFRDILISLESLIYNKNQEYIKQKSEITTLKNEVDSMENKLSNNTSLDKNKIISKLQNGIITEIKYKEGDYVSAKLKLLSIMNLDNMYVKADIPEEFIKDVKVGADVKIIPLADNEKEYHGKVTRILGMAVKNNGETIIPIEISIDDLDKFLIPNLNVDVEISKE